MNRHRGTYVLLSLVLITVLLSLALTDPTAAATHGPVSSGARLPLQNCTLAADLNGDGKVDLTDVQSATAGWPHEGYSIVDIQFIASKLGNTCTSSKPSVPFGVNMGSGDPRARQLAFQAGARWVKTGISWASVESTNVDLTNPANGNWPDTWIEGLVNEGLTVVAGIWQNPGWAASTSCGPLNAGMLAEFSQFLTALVRRYSGPPYNVKYWELYNEPDITDVGIGQTIGGCWGNSGAAYAQMLSVAAAAIHGADQDAKVLLGSLAYEWWNVDFFKNGLDSSVTPGPTEWSTTGSEFPDFLEDVLNNGGGDHFDVMSFHSYVVFHPRWGRPDDGSLPGDVAYEPACDGMTDLSKRPQEGDILGKLIYLKKRLQKHNPVYGGKPFAVTEIGRRSDANQSMLQQGCLGGSVPGSDEQQSRYAVQGNVRAMAAGVEMAIWYDVIDNANGSYGLLDTGLNPKAAYWAYKTATDELMQATYDHQMTVGETGWSAIEGYEFRMPNGKRKWALWTPTKVSGETTRRVSFPASRVRVVPKQKYNASNPDTPIPGVVKVIQDGGTGDLDGAVNGRVEVDVTASPIFVEDVSTTTAISLDGIRETAWLARP